MKQNLEAIAKMAADTGNRQWLISTGRGDVTPRGQEYFHLVEGALDERYERNALPQNSCSKHGRRPGPARRRRRSTRC